MRFTNRSRTKSVFAMSLFVTSFFWFAEDTGVAQQVFNVSTTANSGAGSLRQAITDMNAMGVSPNEIRFQVSGTINVSGQLPSIQRSVTINPNGVSGIVLDGGGGSGDGLTFAESTTQGSNVRGLTIRNFSGAGIRIAPTANEVVNIFNCHIHNNECGVMMTGGVSHTVSEQSLIEFNQFFGVSVGSSVSGVDIVNSSIQSNTNSGVRLAGQNHRVAGCFIVSNGQPETVNTDFGGVVFGSINTQATSCRVENCTLASNTPYGAKIAFGSQNRVSENEIYLNNTKGLAVFSSPTARPTLSHFVVDDVHHKIILRATATGSANAQVDVEIFVAFLETDQGAIFCDDVLIPLNSSGQGKRGGLF
jgi:hypothetical protein